MNGQTRRSRAYREFRPDLASVVLALLADTLGLGDGEASS